MNISFEGQQVLITGGTKGIGKAIAQKFLESGADLVVITGTKKLAQDEATKAFPTFLSKRVEYRQLDFSSNDKNDQIDQIIHDFGYFHVCINNAGINILAKIDNFTEDSLNKVLEVNLVGPAILVNKVSKLMIDNQYGRIVNISSIFGQVTRSGRMNYSSSKFGLIGQSKAIALDLATHKILVNTVSPGFIETELTRRVLGEKGIAEVTSKVPLGRLGTPEEIADGVLFLSSNKNTFITAENLIIDGGFLAT